MNISANLITGNILSEESQAQRNTKLDKHFALQIGYNIKAPHLCFA